MPTLTLSFSFQRLSNNRRKNYLHHTRGFDRAVPRISAHSDLRRDSQRITFIHIPHRSPWHLGNRRDRLLLLQEKFRMTIENQILDALMIVSAWDLPEEELADAVSDQARLMAGIQPAVLRR